MVRRIKGYAYVAVAYIRCLVDLIQVGYIMLALLIGGIVGYFLGKRT